MVDTRVDAVHVRTFGPLPITERIAAYALLVKDGPEYHLEGYRGDGTPADEDPAGHNAFTLAETIAVKEHGIPRCCLDMQATEYAR